MHGGNAESRPLAAGALAVLAPWPAAGPALTILQLLLGPANAAFPGRLLAPAAAGRRDPFIARLGALESH